MHGMRPFGALISKEEALRALLEAATPIARAEPVALAQARERVAAATVRAPIAVPPFDRAMMDGYAVRAGDEGARRVVGEVKAGSADLPRVAAGEAVRIATGAPLPPGADAVVRVEDTEERDGLVTIKRAARPRQSVEAAGTDLAVGDVVIADGDALTPARIGLLASVGIASVAVRARPRVALITSGDELLRPGEPQRPGAIHESNGAALRALFEEAGALVHDRPPLPDDERAIRAALRDAASSSDLVVSTGGASVGAKDLLVDALRAEGRVLFHGVRVKPGKPLLAGMVGASLFVGLPGNPTSALSNAYLFVLPALRRLAGLAEPVRAPIRATLAAEVVGEPDRFLLLPVRVEAGVARPTFKTSGALTSMAASDGWIGVPEGARLAAGAAVEVHSW